MAGYWETGQLEHGGELLMRQVSRHKNPRLITKERDGRSSVKRNCTDCIERLKDSVKRWAWK